MLELQGNILPFPVHYTEGGVAKTGLTVTVDIYERTVAGTVTQVVNDGACTEIGTGLYIYDLAAASVDADAIYLAVFHTATDTVDQQDLPSEWIVGRAWVKKVDDILEDTGTTIPASITNIDGDVADVPAAVWGNSTRTLTQSAASVVAAVSGSDITTLRGDTMNVSLTGLGDLSSYARIIYTAKRDTASSDTEAIIQVDNVTGLIRINGAAGTAGNGSLTVNDVVAGNIRIIVNAAEMALIDGVLMYDVQGITAAGVVTTVSDSGKHTVSADITRAVT